MTYCLAIKVNDGLVFASDSRSNAGVDHVSVYSKMHVFTPQPEGPVFVLLTAGNLATSQAVVNQLQRDLEDPGLEVRLDRARHLFDAAQYVGDVSWRVQSRYAEALKGSGGNVEATFILGGQLPGQAPDAFLIYPEGNYISTSAETPYLQIGETKYGKPILDRVVTPATALEDAARCALVSLDSTIRSNISVGPPIELAIYRRDAQHIGHYLSLELNSPLYAALGKRWNEGLHRAFERLPRFDWE